MDTEPSKNLWAIVLADRRTFIGKMESISPRPTLGGTLRLDPVYEVNTTLVPVRGPNGQAAINKEISAEPFLLSFQGAPMSLCPQGIMLFSDMKEGDLERYKRLVSQAERLAQSARVADAGIVAPTQ